MIIVNSFQPLTIITKHSILDVAAVLDPPLSFTLIFSLTTGIIKKLLSIKRNKKKKYDQILMFAKGKLDSIETLVSQALINMEISHEEFNVIIRDKSNMKG